MRSFVLFGALCAAAVEAGQPHQLFYTQYKTPENCYGDCPLPSYYPRYKFIPAQNIHHLPGYLPRASFPVLFKHDAPLAPVHVPAPVASVHVARAPVVHAPVAPVQVARAPVVHAQVAPVNGAPVAAQVPDMPMFTAGPADAVGVPEMPMLPAGPVGAVRFAGTGDVVAEGTGASFFAGDGEVNFNGQFPIGIIAGQGEADINGSGQIQVATVPGVGAVGTFQNFRGEGSFDGQGFAAGLGTGQVAASGTGVTQFVGFGNFGVNGVGQTTINAPLFL